MRSHHQNSQTNLELCDHIKTKLFDDILKLVKHAIDFSAINVSSITPFYHLHDNT